MARKRLTAATLEGQEKLRVGQLACDLSMKIMGAAATDDELVTAGRLLHEGLGDQRIARLHRMASKVAQEIGEDFPGVDDDGSQPESRDTQAHVAEHELTPDHAVLDVVINEQTPTQDPTAAGRKADEDEKDDEEDPSLEEPEDMEEDQEDYVVDEEGETMEGEEDMDEEEEEEDMDEETMEGEEDMDEDYEEDDEDYDDEDTEDYGDEEPTMEDAEAAFNQEDADDYYEGYDDDDREFTLEDMEELEDLGVDGVLVSSGKKASRKSKKGKKGRTAGKSFRPSRNRAAAGQEDEFSSVFGVPDVGSTFAM